MERDELTQLLDRSSDASSACRDALLEGAELTMWEGLVPASGLLPTYERRQSQTQAGGIPTIGFPEAVATLRDRGAQPLQLGQVTVADPPYMFMVFLDAGASTVVACLGVDRRR